MCTFKNKTLFPLGEKQENENFNGAFYLKMLTDSKSGCPIGNVTFPAGVCNNWHKHPGGQILLVTAGRGYYQEEGKKARELQPGDVVTIPPNVKHWHGASCDSWFSHLAVEVNQDAGPAQWLEPVDPEEYKKLK